jgi:hypothetical protein
MSASPRPPSDPGVSRKARCVRLQDDGRQAFESVAAALAALRMTPAIAAGVSDRLWEIDDIVALVESAETIEDRKRGPYKKKAA